MLVMAVTAGFWGHGGVSLGAWLRPLRFVIFIIFVFPLTLLISGSCRLLLHCCDLDRLVLGVERWKGLVEVGGRHGRDGHLLGGIKHPVGGLEDSLIGILVEFHVTYMCTHVYRQLQAPQG